MSWQNALCVLPMVLLVGVSICLAAEVTSKSDMKVEESTVSPIADMAMLPASPEQSSMNKEASSDAGRAKSAAGDSQRHTVGDFIIHPLIAFKPRTPEDDVPAPTGRQADASSTTPSPWQIFGFNPGQGLGSLAGTVTGWINDRIQLPGLVDTPVRTTTTTTTTTQRPDIVVRVQQRTTRRPLLSLANNNRPNQFNNNNFGFDSDEDEDYDYTPPRRFNRRRFQNNNNLNEEDEDFDSEEDFGNRRGSNQDEDEYVADNSQDEEPSEEEEDDHEEENFSQRPNNRRRPLRNNGNNRRGPNRQNVQNENRRRRPQNDDDDDHDDNNGFFYNSRPSTKRSQSPNNFIQRGQQSLINQIRQLTRVQSPAEVGTLIRQPLTTAAIVPATGNRQQATLLVNRNGQTVYVAPELAATPAAPQYQLYSNNMPLNLRAGQFPQPPLTKPLRLKGQPTQYITIPWNQLGISPPNRLTKVATDLQAEPHILSIPQASIAAMQNPNRKSVRPIITAEAVPLLAEASLMDIFQPPQIPPSRSTIAGVTNTGTKAGSTLPNAAIITAKATKPNAVAAAATPIVVVPQRIRGGTLVEKAPANEADAVAESNESAVATAAEVRNGDNEYILVGEDADPGLTRQVQPVYGDARYVRVSDVQPYYADVVPQRARYGIKRKSGRALVQPEDVMPSTDAIAGSDDKPTTTSTSEQHIPVEIVGDKTQSEPSHSEMELRVAEQKVVEDGAAVSVTPVIDVDSSLMPAVKT